MAPADMKKQGSAFDLAMLIGILSAAQLIGNVDLRQKCFIGELSLSGEVRPVKGVLSMCIAARNAGLTEVFVPADDIIDYKEALVFAFLGLLRSRNEINVLRSVTGAESDSCSGKINTAFRRSS